ncbi:MAG: phosphoribosylformylglycinamidine synthase I [Anaerolineales bacterium]|nr:phosphoribosylformylglycinamidine synthase I [Anaerolineales bacterium]MCZ2120949.1 phosphoribosylformylglycinamidine synthase I [Anaerolineales bacterium]
MKPKALILQAHGSNRDFDVMNALTLAGADVTGVPLNQLRDNKTLLADFQLLVVPGGFSYADALGAGKLLALDLISYFSDEVSAFVEAGKPVIGICNGFQVLVKAGILPGDSVIASEAKQSPTQQEIASGYRPRNDGVTLTFNAEGHFECRWVNLKSTSQTCIWTKDLDEVIACPIAHGEGNFQSIENIAKEHIALTYVHADGLPANGLYPINPNGSTLDIAGITNTKGNVLGLMPHPENHIHNWQHPLHTRGVKNGSGLKLFQNGVKYAKGM